MPATWYSSRLRAVVGAVALLCGIAGLVTGSLTLALVGVGLGLLAFIPFRNTR